MVSASSAHRAVGMQAGGGDADLRAQAQLAAIVEARGRIDHHHRRTQRTARRPPPLRHRWWRSLRCGRSRSGAMCASASSRLVDDPHRDDQVEEFGGVVGLAGRRGDRHQGAACASSPRTSTPCARQRRRSARGRKSRGDVAMHQQGFQRIAHAGARGLAVDQQAQRRARCRRRHRRRGGRRPCSA